MSGASDDPRLTAYALGELPAAEATEVEALLARDEDARQLVEAVRATAALLEAELGAEAAVPFAREVAAPRRRRWPWVAGAGSVLAAAAAVALVVLPAREAPDVAAAKRGATPARQVETLPDRFVTMIESNRAATERKVRKERMIAALSRAANPRADEDSPDGFHTGEARPPVDRDRFDHIEESGFVDPRRVPLSTFSIDVDTASYSLVRRFLHAGRTPPAGAVRIEELVNYFTYDDPPPDDGSPFATHVEVASAPWAPAHRLVRIGLKARDVPRGEATGKNLVFLVDVSGSMKSADKLPLLRRSFGVLLNRLEPTDRVAIVVYAGASGLVLPSTPVARRRDIEDALARLEAGGTTNGGAGIELAYRIAREHFVPGGVNRVILATDGDFNVGTTSESELVRLIEARAQSGVYLTVLGFGLGNLNDALLEKLTGKGNGNYAYIDTLDEARKALGRQVAGTLVTVARDVKIQVELNPAKVAAYRLIGYENRALADRDFNDDAKDAGDIGAGHSVTALYEIVPAGLPVPGAGTDPLKYQAPAEARPSDELLTVKLRAQPPEGGESKLWVHPVRDGGRAFEAASTELRFAAAVAAFGMLLRGSEHASDATFTAVRAWAARALGPDSHGERAAFLELVERASRL